MQREITSGYTNRTLDGWCAIQILKRLQLYSAVRINGRKEFGSKSDV